MFRSSAYLGNLNGNRVLRIEILNFNQHNSLVYQQIAKDFQVFYREPLGHYHQKALKENCQVLKVTLAITHQWI